MRRTGILLSAALFAAGPALAFEGGTIRSGEHDGFSRIVMRIEPTTEWSLETTSDKAVIRIPGKALDFSTEGIFARMPRTRVQAVRTRKGPAGTTLEIDLGCDCRVSASFVNARYLAIDVTNRDYVPPAAEGVEAGDDAPASQAASAGSVEARAETEARRNREDAAVADAEGLLLRQLERAASQGLIELADAEPTEAAGAEPADEQDAPAPVVEAPEPLVAPAPPERPNLPQRDAAADDAHDLSALLDHEQIAATTVYDRDGRALAERPAVVEPPEACLEDARFDVGSWSNGLPLSDQKAVLNRRLVGEFDTPDPDAVLALARLYIRFGFGAEAESLLEGFDVAADDRELLIDLARTVAERPVATGGPLAIPDACGGPHGLWLALGGAAPVFHDKENFGTVQAAFAQLPPDLRTFLGPQLVDRLLDARQRDAARLIYETTTRPGEATGADLRLSQARLVAVEGHPLEALQAMNELVEENAPNAADALSHAIDLALKEKLVVPERLIGDLRTAIALYRGTAREVWLRSLLASAEAGNARLDNAMLEIDTAQTELPHAAPVFAALRTRLLAAADPERIGPARYAETIIANSDEIGTSARNDAARRMIAQRLTMLGLSNAALDVLEPAVRRGDGAARQLAAEAFLRLGEPDPALAVLGDLENPEVAELRARALAQGGSFGEALATLDQAGFPIEADRYAWPSGNWPRTLASDDDPERRAMAGYMAARGGVGAAPQRSDDPESLDPAEAFQEPLPPLEQPSLDAARRLLAAGSQLEGFVQNLITSE